MSDLIEPGTYLAKITDYGISETKQGLPQAEVKLMLNNGKTMFWNGSFKEGRAQEITIDALLVMGLRSDDPLDIARGVSSGMLDTEKEVAVVVEHDTYEGKTRAKIRWINNVSGVKRMDTTSAKQKLGNLKGAVMARRQETGIQKTDDEIPF